MHIGYFILKGNAVKFCNSPRCCNRDWHFEPLGNREGKCWDELKSEDLPYVIQEDFRREGYYVKHICM